MTGYDLSRAEWHKSSHSGQQGNCVEVGEVPGVVAVRDSKDPDGPKLIVSPRAWQEFTAALKAGDTA